MAFQIESGELARVAVLPRVRSAAETGADLIGLWPLKEAVWMSNDVQYSETLQVRVTRAVAELLLGAAVPMADAEFIYDGAMAIPGRPEDEVELLVKVTDAYEQMSGYCESGDTAQIMAGAGDLGVDWDEETATQMAHALEVIETACGAGSDGKNQSSVSADTESVAQRFSLVCVACSGLLDILSGKDSSVSVGAEGSNLTNAILTGVGLADNDSEVADKAKEADEVSALARRCTPLLMYINELCERVSLPRLELEPSDMLALSALYVGQESKALGRSGDRAEALANALAPMAAKEWQHHHDELIYDAEEAKKAADEKEEKAKKAKLAAKFADIPEDPNKKPIDL